MLFHPTRFLDLNTTLNRTIILNGCKLEALNCLLTTSIILDSFPLPLSGIPRTASGARPADHHPTPPLPSRLAGPPPH